MKAATERTLIRWVHILLSLPLFGYIYGPLAQNPGAARAIRGLYLPVVVLTGLWLWKGHLVKKLFRRRYNSVSGRTKSEA